jgi:hypothetical protein
MKLTVTATTDSVALGWPFFADMDPDNYLDTGDTAEIDVQLKHLVDDRWQEIVRLQQMGHITLAWDPRANALFGDEEYLAEFNKTSGTAADPVATTAALIAVEQEDRADRQIRLVQDTNSLYRFELGAVAGGLTPSDVDDGRWFEVGGLVQDWGLVGELVAVGADAAVVGAIDKIARIDHVHGVDYGLVGELATQGYGVAAAPGVTAKPARVDHVHPTNRVAPADEAPLAANIGIPFTIVFPIPGGATEYVIFNGDAPFAFRILDVTVRCDAANALGTATLEDTVGGGGTAITDAIVMAVDEVVTRAGTINNAVADVALAGDLIVVTNGAGDIGQVAISCVKLP